MNINQQKLVLREYELLPEAHTQLSVVLNLLRILPPCVLSAPFHPFCFLTPSTPPLWRGSSWQGGGGGSAAAAGGEQTKHRETETGAV